MTPALAVIKDKPSDMGIKSITDKDSWTEAKKIINARLRRAPYWPGESKELITTDANAAASIWWEEVIAFYCKPPVSDLFVEEHRFDGKGFEMIAHIDQHFNPSGAVDSLAYIFDLIDIKQTEQESVVTLKARFSKAFSALKMGGIGIDSALQVGFMLRALLSKYHAVVQEFRLGRHSLSDASLQTVVEQCTNYDKDPWKGPVGKDGKVPKSGPSANAAGADAGDLAFQHIARDDGGDDRHALPTTDLRRRRRHRLPDQQAGWLADRQVQGGSLAGRRRGTDPRVRSEITTRTTQATLGRGFGRAPF